MINSLYVRIFMGVLFAFSASTYAHSITLESLLNERDPVTVLKGLDKPAKQVVIREILSAVKGSSSMELTRIAFLLCDSPPWSSGDVNIDRELQKSIWSRALNEIDAHTELFKSLDCAAAKMQNFYFDTIVYPISEYREYGIIPKKQKPSIDVEELKDAIVIVDTAILNNYDYSSVDSQQPVSYYPLRNASRMATLLVAEGIFVGDKNWDLTLSFFGNAASKLDEWNNEERLKLTRNGWRRRVELSFLSALYGWISEGTNKPFDAQIFENWPYALSEEITERSIPNSIRSSIPNDYVDRISIERLFPGAADEINERLRWRERNFDVREFSSHVSECSKVNHVNNLSELRDFDNCIANYEAKDWRIQFEAFRGEDPNGALAQNRIGVYQSALDGLDLAGYFPAGVPTVTAYQQGSWVVVSTEPKITDSQRDSILRSIDQEFPSSFFGRPRSY